MNPQVRRIFVAMVLAAAGWMAWAGALAGPVAGVAEAAPVTLRFWTTSAPGGSMDGWVKEFERLNPDIRVEAQYMGNYDEMAQKLLAAVAGRTPPHVAQLGQRHGIPQLVDADALVPVERFLSQVDLADIIPGLWSRYTYKNQRWVIPFQPSTPGLWINRTALRQTGLDPAAAPATWEELLRMAQRLTADTNGDGRPDRWGFGSCADVPWYVRPMVLQAGGTLFDEAGRPQLTSEAAVKALGFFRDVVHTYHAEPPMGHQTAERDFISGRYALLFCSTSVRGYYEKEIGSQFELGVAAMPKEKEQAVGLGGNALAIFRSDPEHERAAWRLVQYLTATERMVQIATETGYVPIRRSAVQSPAVQQLLRQNERARIIYDQLPLVKDHPIHPADALIWRGLLRAVEQVQTSAAVEPRAALERLQSDVEVFMEGYRSAHP
ncbi:ABC transporter substrate-binding protein [Carboxydochorda subterranea]|uniref:ABC transporter substrate-binding protein n=1 Tax=Carboxydichorda subterranea TaxID=3109565 RepID=A0ABZ1BXY1_9FIRM|nr:ABC transporter substrate-binding protein [Limnochorda sp. L945t]WRP17541.1 ABC transporter substrate-binding protein [Limnochorda sp. L945t]